MNLNSNDNFGNIQSHTAITCTWSGGTFATSILYRNPHLGSAYDVALLHIPDGIRVPDAAFARCAPANTTTIGQRVFATGFPHFYALAKVQFAPSILEGRITKVGEHMLQTDASIQAGQSGGPLLNADGDVVAVMVSNTRESSALGRIHPHVNMCIPMGAIVEILAEYAECKGWCWKSNEIILKIINSCIRFGCRHTGIGSNAGFERSQSTLEPAARFGNKSIVKGY